MADMGHYSLWTPYNALQLTSPGEDALDQPDAFCNYEWGCSRPGTQQFLPDGQLGTAKNAANGDRPAMDVIWYDGGMRQALPDELISK